MLPALFFLLFILLPPMIHSHALLCTPRQRGAYTTPLCGGSPVPHPPNSVPDHCPHCLNGGTVLSTRANLPAVGWLPYSPETQFELTASRAGICGDPLGNREHQLGGKFMPYSSAPIVKTYTAGSVIDFQVEIDTNHNGFFQFRLCNMDTCPYPDIHPDCFKKQHCQLLERVPAPKCEQGGRDTWEICGKIDPRQPSKWFVPCRKKGVQRVGGLDGSMRYKLPQGFKCKWCVLQWYYATGNSCAPKGFLDYFRIQGEVFGGECESDGGGNGGYRKGMSECKGNLVPEEFWACADISIRDAVEVPYETPQQRSSSRGRTRTQTQPPPTTTTRSRSPRTQTSSTQPPTRSPSTRSWESFSTRAPSTQTTRISSTVKHRSDGSRSQAGQSMTRGVGNKQGYSTEVRCVPNEQVCSGESTDECCEPRSSCVYRQSVRSLVCRRWVDLGTE